MTSTKTTTMTSKENELINTFTDEDEYSPSPPPFSPYLTDSKHPESTQPLPPPPSYNDTPIPELALNTSFLSKTSIKLHMKGHYTSPNFEIYDPSIAVPILEVETDSHWVSHDMCITDVRYGRRTNLFSVKRKDTTNSGEKDNWFYTANATGKHGKRLLEIETRPDLLTNGSKQTRLKFRNVSQISELEALDLKMRPGSDLAEVLYRGDKVGEIRKTGHDKKPSFVLDVSVAGIDPLLFVVLALVIDDRGMTVRRRRKRAIGREALGIGKGPGAGLAGAYGLASII